MSRQILNPEVNSDLILRADILSETSLLTSPSPLPPGSSEIDGFFPFRQIRRRLLPRQPKRDRPLDQLCTFYRSIPTSSSSSSNQGQGEDGIVEYRCLVDSEEEIPFYHPTVSSIRFIYTANSFAPVIGTLQISFQLFPSSPPRVFKESDKLFRIGLRLLGTLWKHGNGIATGYKKRVHHDIVVQKEGFQDLYLELKEKYGSLESRVVLEGKEGKEDVKRWMSRLCLFFEGIFILILFLLNRHVWKDVAITTFLILLWRDLYPPILIPREPMQESATSSARSAWGAPPGGFVDIGCGNGLLVHILTSEVIFETRLFAPRLLPSSAEITFSPPNLALHVLGLHRSRP